MTAHSVGTERSRAVTDRPYNFVRGRRERSERGGSLRDTSLILGSLCPRGLKETGSAKNVSINFGILSPFRLKISFSRLQTFVGLAAGVLSIAGALAAFLRPAPDKGVLMAIVQDAQTEKAVSDATIEILTPRDALVKTLTPDWSGKARCTLDEGRYRLRVSHPRYRAEVREVQLISRENTEVRVQLRAGDPLGRSIRRLFHH